MIAFLGLRYAQCPFAIGTAERVNLPPATPYRSGRPLSGSLLLYPANLSTCNAVLTAAQAAPGPPARPVPEHGRANFYLYGEKKPACKHLYRIGKPSEEWHVRSFGKHRLWLVLGLVFSVSNVTYCANASKETSASYQIESWDTDRGLPQNSVTTIVQTRDGYLWFGTLNGLVRFDGLQFDIFDENNVPELGSSQIVSLFEDPEGNLWVGTRTAGVVLISPRGQVKSLGLGLGASDKYLAAACADRTGGVWLYLADGQLWYCTADRLLPFVFGHDSPSKTRAIIAEVDGAVWVGTERRLATIEPHTTTVGLEPAITSEIQSIRLDFLLASRNGGHWRLADGHVQFWRNGVLARDYGPYPWSRVPIAAACEDMQDRLVVGTLGAGLFLLEPDGTFARISTAQGLSHNVVLSVCA
ncbi:MAG: hypothetical protein N3G20_08935, partial [Verrucomicrobiae bacterium]|nr:hypothetical protein [Verrucomicrobiae bacterium]